MFDPQTALLGSTDQDVQHLIRKAARLHRARIEQRRQNLECLSADGLIALARMHPPDGNPYLAAALVAEFWRRMSEPLSEADIDLIRSAQAGIVEAVHPSEPVPADSDPDEATAPVQATAQATGEPALCT